MSFETAIKVPAARGERSGERLWIVVAPLMLLAATLRFWEIGSRALWLDEAYSGWFSALSWSELWFETPKYETHPPVYYSLLKLWQLFAGTDAGALRGLSALAGIAAVPVLGLAAVELARLTRAPRPLLLVAIACAFAAVSPRLIVIAQEARPYPLLLLAYGSALLFWLRLTASFRRHGPPAGSWGNWVGIGLSTLAVLWLHAIGILYGAALFGALLLTGWEGADRRRWTRLAVTATLTGLAWLPCLALILGRTGDWGSGWLTWDPARFPGAMLDLYGLHHLDEPVSPVAARIVMALLMALALRTLWRSGDRPLAGALGLLLLFPPLAAALMSQLGFPLFLPRTLVAVLAPAYLIAAWAIASLPRERVIIAAGAVGLIFAANLAQTLVRPSLEAWDEAAAILHREMKPGDVIWTYPNDVALPLGAALGRDRPMTSIPAPFPALSAPGYRRSGSPAVVTVDARMAADWARRQAPPPGATIWLVWVHTNLSDPEGDVEESLSTGRAAGPVRRWRDLRLVPLRPR